MVCPAAAVDSCGCRERRERERDSLIVSITLYIFPHVFHKRKYIHTHTPKLSSSVALLLFQLMYVLCVYTYILALSQRAVDTEARTPGDGPSACIIYEAIYKDPKERDTILSFCPEVKRDALRKSEDTNRQ